MPTFDNVYYEEGITCKCGKIHYDFQTNSFDNLLEQFTINKDGTISGENYKMVDVPLNERNDFGFPFLKKELLGFYNVNLTDTIQIFTYCGHDECFIEALLTFVDGKIVHKIVRVNEVDF